MTWINNSDVEEYVENMQEKTRSHILAASLARGGVVHRKNQAKQTEILKGEKADSWEFTGSLQEELAIYVYALITRRALQAAGVFLSFVHDYRAFCTVQAVLQRLTNRCTGSQ